MFSIPGLSANWTSLIILLAIIAAVWILDRKNFKREGIMFLRRTEKGLKFIDAFAKKHQRFFRLFGTIGIILSFGALGVAYVRREQKKSAFTAALAAFIAGFVFLLFIANMNNLPALFSSLFGLSGLMMLELVLGLVKTVSLGPAAPPVVQPVLPICGVNGIFCVPIEFWLVSIFIILVVHEFSHAFVSRAEGIHVKSLGYGFMAVIPVGFAEPDEGELKKTASIKRSRIFAAGSFSNFITAIISIILFTGASFLTSAIYTNTGITYNTVITGTPADISLPHNGTITEVNSREVKNAGELTEVMNGVFPGSDISIIVDGRRHVIKTAQDPNNASRAFIGISGIDNIIVPKEQFAGIAGGWLQSVLLYLYSLFKWLFFLNLGIGLFNLLPLKPLDGGLIFEEIAKEFFGKAWKSAYTTVAAATLGLLLMNLFGAYFVKAIVAML